MIKNYWMRLSRILRIIQTEVSFASADNADRGLNDSDILRKPNSIIFFIIHSPRKIGDANKK